MCVTTATVGSAPELAACTTPTPPSQLWTWSAATQQIRSAAMPGLCFSVATPPPPLVSSVFGDHMVLQRGVSNPLWGWVQPGVSVSVAIPGFPTVHSDPAGSDGKWTVALAPLPPSRPYNITVLDLATGNTQVLQDVLSGDVHWCSGQSNLAGQNTPVRYVFNATAEVEAASLYPWIRVFQVGNPGGSDTPLSRLPQNPEIPWSVASPSSVAPFSATCWFYGKTIADALGPSIPIGLVESAWGGTSIQVWLPSESIQACGNPPAYPGGWPTSPAALWNSMTFPFAGMRFAGMVWYQGESNSLTTPVQDTYYLCALPFLVSSLRKLFNSPEMHAGVVQLAPWASSSASYNAGVASLRHAQLLAGDAPSVNISVVTAVDDGDPGAPIGSIHPRGKQVVGARLGAALLTALYQRSIPYAGPRYVSGVSGGAVGSVLSATLTFSLSSMLVRAPSPTGPYANSSVCPAGVSSDLCTSFEILASDGKWYPATADLAGAGKVLLSATGAPLGLSARATACGWSLWPISLLYDGAGHLPAFPWNATLE